MCANRVKHTKSSGNVYQDLGFANSEERLAKAKLAARINDIVQKRGLKQIEAASILNITQPKISALANGKLGGFSMEKLINFLNLLSQDVIILIKANPAKRANKHGKLKVAFG